MLKKRLKRILFCTLILGTILACGYQTVLQMSGYSMEPAITDSQKLYTEEVSLSDLNRGDIIYFEISNALLVKRLIGLPGETIEVRDGKIYIDGEILVENYEISVPEYVVLPITLGEDEYFVLGDNRNNSKDSHDYGPIKGDQIKGRVFLIR